MSDAWDVAEQMKETARSATRTGPANPVRPNLRLNRDAMEQTANQQPSGPNYCTTFTRMPSYSGLASADDNTTGE